MNEYVLGENRVGAANDTEINFFGKMLILMNSLEKLLRKIIDDFINAVSMVSIILLIFCCLFQSRNN